ncbi:MAG: cupin domain-containing protein [Chromatiales bacterium]|nr:cupin domain-containing protein [Chromatiales bacterium]
MNLPLGGMSAEQFLTEYWQKKPLVIRNALPDFACPITPEEMGGLAMEEEVESRIILENSGDWLLKCGPFKESDLTSLPDTHWTLLVQEANKHIPEFALLQEDFNFLPNWRLDDVMVSFAPEHGTVGPHADNYDVFLIQGPGRRRWQLSYQECGPDQLIPGLPVRILADFVPEEEYILEEGDILYLPPGVVHHGVSLEDAITISVGYRAPAIAELAAAYCAETVSLLDSETFYADADIEARQQPGLITAKELGKVRNELRTALSRSDEELNRWFASFTSDVKPGHYLPEPEEELSTDEFLERLNEAGELWRSEYARFAYIEQAGNTLLYVAGEEIPLATDLAFAAPLLSGQRVFGIETLLPHLQVPGFADLLTGLYNLGAIYFPEL